MIEMGISKFKVVHCVDCRHANRTMESYPCCYCIHANYMRQDWFQKKKSD